MSLYDVIFGANPTGHVILATLGLTPGDSGEPFEPSKRWLDAIEALKRGQA